MISLPQGFSGLVANIGIKDDTDDFSVVVSDRPCAVAGVFTQSRFAGPSIAVSRRHVSDGVARGFVVISKNANVANGPEGLADAEEVVGGVAAALGVETEDLLIASTGVIGRRYPMDVIRNHLADMVNRSRPSTDATEMAGAIMTTDTFAKVATASFGPARIVGIAKGVGMIEPNMATMLAFIMTDADIDRAELDTRFRHSVERSFNSLSVDSDTSTSDTAIVLANGAAGDVDPDEFGRALDAVCLELTRMLATDGEGATTLIEVEVTEAVDDAQAKNVAKAILNSPLVKTAVFGRDPNWGRIAMAIGKVPDERILEDKVHIAIGDQELFPRRCSDADLDALSAYLAGERVEIHVSLGLGQASWRVYGCDLSYDYVRINAEYTT